MSGDAGGIGALYGPLHGGANEAVIKMLIRLKTPDNIPAFLEAVKDKKEKLFGFGHRVYKNFDPRAKLIQQIASDVRNPGMALARHVHPLAFAYATGSAKSWRRQL